MAITIRYFAAAKSATGVGQQSFDGAGRTIGALLEQTASSAPDAATTAAVFARCSFLLNGQATTDRAVTLADGDLLDVLPPFAGG